MKESFESRINQVCGYAGSVSLAAAICSSLVADRMTFKKSDPRWILARACMTPDEYAAHGNDGAPWNFLRQRPDWSQFCIDSCRAVVDQRLKNMGYVAHWGRI